MNGLALTIVDRPAAQAPRLLGGRRRADRRDPRRSCRASSDGEANGTAAVIGIASLVRHPGAEPVAAEGPERPRRRRPGRRWRSTCFDLRGARGRHDRRTAAGVPAVHGPDGRRGRRSSRRWSSARSPSPSSRSPTPCRRPRRSPPARGERVHGNQEMIGIGAANIAAGLLPGLPGQHERLAHRGRRAGRAPGRR